MGATIPHSAKHTDRLPSTVHCVQCSGYPPQCSLSVTHLLHPHTALHWQCALSSVSRHDPGELQSAHESPSWAPRWWNRCRSDRIHLSQINEFNSFTGRVLATHEIPWSWQETVSSSEERLNRDLMRRGVIIKITPARIPSTPTNRTIRWCGWSKCNSNDIDDGYWPKERMLNEYK